MKNYELMYDARILEFIKKSAPVLFTWEFPPPPPGGFGALANEYRSQLFPKGQDLTKTNRHFVQTAVIFNTWQT